jgi:hypothetical protein
LEGLHLPPYIKINGRMGETENEMEDEADEYGTQGNKYDNMLEKSAYISNTEKSKWKQGNTLVKKNRTYHGGLTRRST